MSIPKIIHYCWFGGNPLPDNVVKCIESWKKYCPDYEIKQWTEENYDVNNSKYSQTAYKEKKWAFVADYARLDILYKYGGIYFDTDVELIGNIDFLLENQAFMGIEKYSLFINTGQGYGCEAKNIHVGNLLNIYNSLSFYDSKGNFNIKPCTVYTTDYFKGCGYELKDKFQQLEGVAIYPSEYFCPIDYSTGNIKKTTKTIGIHWYDATWVSVKDQKIHDMEIKIRKNGFFSISSIACFFYIKIFKIIDYTKKGVLLKKLKEKIFK